MVVAAKAKPVEKTPDDALTSLTATAYETIKGRILQNAYPGGFQVLEDQLCG
jgi:DNA-binding GntR family transcriptional regulator